MTTKLCGLLFGAVLSSGIAFAPEAGASTYQLLYSFQGPPGDGWIAESGVVMDAGGNLYGTTYRGGSGTHCWLGRKLGCGAVYKIAPDGSETLIYSFQGRPDGALPYAGSLILDTDGNLIGTTTAGGRNTGHGGCGTIFKLTPAGSETLLHSFRCSGDGRHPVTGVVMDGAGNLYGATPDGPGTNCHANFGCGVVYKLAADGRYSILYGFKGGADGAQPYAALTLDDAGNLYGTTQVAGDTNCKNGLGCGTVFEISPDGSETTLHIFEGGVDDGFQPLGGVLRDGAGNLYGTTIYGGSTGNYGAGYGLVYKLAPDGGETILHAFSGPDGQAPYAGLAADGAGNLYGTTWIGGSDGHGVVFELAPDGTETVLHSFATGRRYGGAYPTASVIVGGDGNLYGTAEGSHSRKTGYGAVFRIVP